MTSSTPSGTRKLAGLITESGFIELPRASGKNPDILFLKCGQRERERNKVSSHGDYLLVN